MQLQILQSSSILILSEKFHKGDFTIFTLVT